MDRRNDARYQHVLNRLRDPASGDVLLDLGCCVGQFIRQLSFDGVDESRLIGVDLYQSFINIGYDLFRDRGRLRASFVAGDMLDPTDKGLQALDGKITIIHANNFWHLFNWQHQVAIGVRAVSLLKRGGPRAMIYGRQIGRTKSVDSVHSVTMKKTSTSWLHNQESFQRLWDEVGAKTGTRWQVTMEFSGEMPWKIPGFATDSKPARYGVYQL